MGLEEVVKEGCPFCVRATECVLSVRCYAPVCAEETREHTRGRSRRLLGGTRVYIQPCGRRWGGRSEAELGQAEKGQGETFPPCHMGECSGGGGRRSFTPKPGFSEIGRAGQELREGKV